MLVTEGQIRDVIGLPLFIKPNEKKAFFSSMGEQMTQSQKKRYVSNQTLKLWEED